MPVLAARDYFHLRNLWCGGAECEHGAGEAGVKGRSEEALLVSLSGMAGASLSIRLGLFAISLARHLPVPRAASCRI